MKLAIDEAIVADTLSVTRIASSLLVLTTLIDRLRDVVEKVRDQCEPAVFYWLIRPWFHGGQREMEGVVDPLDKERWLITDFGGPSAGQSTLIHALDIFLGVDHRPHPSQTSSNPMKQGVPSGEETFMARMAVYMPSHHRRFLSELAASLEHSSKITTFPSLPDVATHSVRSLALASPATSDLRSSYNDCVAALGRLRSTHSKVVLLYIVSQSRHPPPEGSAFMDAWLEKQRLEAEMARQPARAHLGTGGTDLAKFLKRCRERTTAALID
jgi:indoleamine 2,3-dioxygenase